MKESFLLIANEACGAKEEDLRVWKRPMMCLTDDNQHPARSPTIWLWISDILLDSNNQALVLDCCIMPVTGRHDPQSMQLGGALAQDKYEIAFVKVRIEYL